MEHFRSSLKIRKIAVVGPLANQTKVLLGNYSGKPTHSVSILDGIKSQFPNATINYISGIQFLRNDGDPVPDSVLSDFRRQARSEG